MRRSCVNGGAQPGRPRPVDRDGGWVRRPATGQRSGRDAVAAPAAAAGGHVLRRGRRARPAAEEDEMTMTATRASRAPQRCRARSRCGWPRPSISASSQLLRALRPEDWTKPTECPGWDVRAMAAHALGMVEMAASDSRAGPAESGREAPVAAAAGCSSMRSPALQVDERAGMTPEQIVARFAARGTEGGTRPAPHAGLHPPATVARSAGRRRREGSLDIRLPDRRDPHPRPVDAPARTSPARPARTTCSLPDHDGVLVADVVAEWAARHGQPYTLRLTGPTGGEWSSGTGAAGHRHGRRRVLPRRVRPRHRPTGLLTTAVPF